MTIRTIGQILFFLPVAMLWVVSMTQAAERPNIILVLIDDMGWADLSCFGNTEAKTPNLDRMAAEGIRFEQFYVNSPICSPSRVAVMTGQYPQRWRITSYLAHRRQNRQRGMADWLDPRAPMLSRSLQVAGYATGHFGKWHMGGQRDVADAPAIGQYGFDESLTNFEGMGPKLLPLVMRPDWDRPRRIWEDGQMLGGPVIWKPRCRITGGYVDAAISFIKRARRDGKPFYINLWPDDVHSPYYPPLDRWGQDKRALYLAVLVEMDQQFKPLFDYLRADPDLRDNTLVLIFSDNGHEPGAGRAGPFKGCKTNLYEAGIRSPLIVWGPGLVHRQMAGRWNRRSVLAAIDLAPSLLRLASVEPPAGVTYDGQDMLDSLLGRSTASRRGPLFFSRPPDRKNFYGYQNLPDLAVRWENWKLLCDADGSRPQLYDLARDPGEQHNLADRQPQRVARLTAQVLQWSRQVRALTGPADGPHGPDGQAGPASRAAGAE